jgi:hypothetical protein
MTVIDAENHIETVKFTLVSYYAMWPPGITQTLRVKAFEKLASHFSQ